MEYKDIIYKTPVKHGLINYENTYKDFNWEDIYRHFDHFSEDGVNIAHEAIDRHANNSYARIRLPCIGKMKTTSKSSIRFQT